MVAVLRGADHGRKRQHSLGVPSMALLLVAAAAAAAARGGGGAAQSSAPGPGGSSVPQWATTAGYMRPAERERLRLQAKEMFYHGYDSVRLPCRDL